MLRVLCAATVVVAAARDELQSCRSFLARVTYVAEQGCLSGGGWSVRSQSGGNFTFGLFCG